MTWAIKAHAALPLGSLFIACLSLPFLDLHGWQRERGLSPARHAKACIKSIRKTWKCNIIWFNPPYSKLLKTNIGKYFFRLLNKHFPPGHKLYKIFSNNTLKLSYSCMSNLKAKIDGHNKKMLETTPPPKTKLCNCLKKEKWPMRGACLTESLLYYWRISCDDET